jgi:hypothetical protein
MSGCTANYVLGQETKRPSRPHLWSEMLRAHRRLLVHPGSPRHAAPPEPAVLHEIRRGGVKVSYLYLRDDG